MDDPKEMIWFVLLAWIGCVGAVGAAGGALARLAGALAARRRRAASARAEASFLLQGPFDDRFRVDYLSRVYDRSPRECADVVRCLGASGWLPPQPWDVKCP